MNKMIITFHKYDTISNIFFSEDSSSHSLQNYLISSMIYMEVHPEKYQFSERGRNLWITLYYLYTRPGCRVTTCSICKAASHGILDCPKDDATAAVLATAHEAGWSRCCGCRALVELAHGCYHMTCRCRAEFCYLCSVPWKNCKCAQWDEGRLVEEARARTARYSLKS
jgi:hypothetical protein